MGVNTTAWDPADYIDTPEDAAAYINAALTYEDPAFLVQAIGDLARARSMGKVAADTGLSRESLYRALSDKGNPRFFTIVRVLDSLGLRVCIEPKPAAAEYVEGAPALESEAFEG